MVKWIYFVHHSVCPGCKLESFSLDFETIWYMCYFGPMLGWDGISTNYLIKCVHDDQSCYFTFWAFL